MGQTRLVVKILRRREGESGREEGIGAGGGALQSAFPGSESM